jgi:hypothetical protein
MKAVTCVVAGFVKTPTIIRHAPLSTASQSDGCPLTKVNTPLRKRIDYIYTSK